MALTRANAEASDDLDILSAIWILSCNDENPIITYEGLKHRLGLPSDYDVKALVTQRGEMFRQGVPLFRLNKWKEDLLLGKQQPSFIRKIENENERIAKIQSLTPDHVFRNQFRAEAKSPRCQIEIIDWGLQHIDRLRKARVEAREEKTKKWKDIRIPFISAVIALTAVIGSCYTQIKSINTQEKLQMIALDTQKDLKFYEVESKPKLEGYYKFMKLISESYDNASKNDGKALNDSLREAELTYYTLEPFLISTQEDLRLNVWHKFKDFSVMCGELKDQSKDSANREEYHNRFVEYKNSLQSVLYHILFKQ